MVVGALVSPQLEIASASSGSRFHALRRRFDEAQRATRCSTAVHRLGARTRFSMELLVLPSRVIDTSQ